MKTFGLIPARAGSKGIPRKNLKMIAGKPLIAWTIETALRARSLDSVIVSTEDEEIADVARQHGAEVPFMRPAELARDDTPGIEPALHALEYLRDWPAIVLLQPTSPLRTADDIDACVELAERRDAPSAASVVEPGMHPYWMYRLGSDQRMAPILDAPEVANRQDLPIVYAMNGAVYYARADWLRTHRTFVTADTVGYVMPPERSVDLDTPLDWRFAEMLLHERQ